MKTIPVGGGVDMSGGELFVSHRELIISTTGHNNDDKRSVGGTTGSPQQR